MGKFDGAETGSVETVCIIEGKVWHVALTKVKNMLYSRAKNHWPTRTVKQIKQSAVIEPSNYLNVQHGILKDPVHALREADTAPARRGRSHGDARTLAP